MGKGGRHNLEVKSTYCSCKEPGFGAQQLHGSLQPSVTPIPGLHTCGAYKFMQAHIYAHTS